MEKQTITPFIWFNNQAEEAVNFYVSIFKDSMITSITRYDKDGAKASGMKEGSVMTIAFILNGQEFTAINGGEYFKLTPAISFYIKCKNQKVVDHFWEKLSSGGQVMPCGWVTDRFGVTWQVVPEILVKYLADKDKEKSQRVMKAMLQMKKIDIEDLKNAYEED